MTSSAHPLLYQVNTRVWLARLSQELSRPATLDDIPANELESIASQGFEWVYFLGVWQTGKVGRDLSRNNPEWLVEYQKTLPDLTEADICGSPFAITGYTAHLAMGGNEALQRLRQRLNQRGLRLMLDFVPNHTALDHPWVIEHPEYYVAGSEDRLKEEPQNYARVQTQQGMRIMARGRDPYFPGWPDTLQLNYGRTELQRVMQHELEKIAGLCDGLRCDMAMLALPEIFKRTWGIEVEPFWPAAISAVRKKFPGFIFMAEVYWNLESALLEQGFDYAYDKSLYDCLRKRNATLVREHLQGNFANLDKLAHFLENHDEARAAAVFPLAVLQAAAVVTFLSPGLRFFHQGQIEGFQTKISVHLCRGPNETVNPGLKEFYGRLLACMQMDALRAGKWRLLSTQPAWEGNPTHADFISSAWQGQSGECVYVVVNYSSHPSQCYAPLPFPELGGELVQLVDCLGTCVYQRQGDSLITTGLYLDLPAWGYHVFDLTRLKE
jgi:hypothetical protein